MKKNIIEKIKELIKEYKKFEDIPAYELVENDIPEEFWTKGQLINYICFLKEE